MKKIDSVLKKIIKLCNPISVFLYGSRARTDFMRRSDYEVGVLIPENRYVTRSQIKKNINMSNINIYPFKLENFSNYIIDTPFQKSIYLRELIMAGKTLYGEKIIEKMKPPAIAVVDLMQDLRFNIGYALASVNSHRNNDRKTASLEFYKSCLFGTRTLLILKKKKFALTYDDIYNYSKKVDLDVYAKLTEKAYQCRLGKNKYVERDLFENISYLNKFIESQLIKYFKKNGNKIILK